ncbi:MAG: FkbM family methyltransferase [Thermoguttaceae bacterium]
MTHKIDRTKIWRAIKRPFLRPLSLVPKSIKQAILSHVMASPSPKFCEQLYGDELKKRERGELFFDRARNDFWGTSKKRYICDLQEKLGRLLSGMDELSHETVDRFWCLLNSCNGFALPMSYARLKQFYGPQWPLYFQECDRIEQLEKTWKNPYHIKGITYSLDGHMATGFGVDYFPPEVQRQIVGKDVIDGGGCCGDSAMILSEYAPRHVYSFEPNPESIPAMVSVLDDNAVVLGERRQKISVVPFALGKTKGKIEIRTSGMFDGGTTTTTRGVFDGMKTYNCDVTALDDYVREKNLNVGLIKLDIEGAEYDAICGAIETIRSQKPLLIISIYHTAKDFLEIKPLIEKLNIGYKFFVRHLHIDNHYGEYCLFGYVDGAKLT